jgi:RNA polymerase sigma-70 factor (ECF subfamily)
MQVASPRRSQVSWTPEFGTTHWSVVLQAGGDSSPAARAALDQLCHAYWLPLYAYARRRGKSPEDAQDLTQEFLAELLARRSLAGVSPAKGKFRSFLLAGFKHFLAKDWRERQALKRGGSHRFVPLDAALAEECLASTPASEGPADRLFDQRWALAVMEQALDRLRQEWVAAQKEPVFTELKVFLTAAPDEGGYAEAGVHLGMTAGAVSTAVHRLRRRYRELVRVTLAQTVTSPLELEEEMRYLLEVLT